MNQQVAVIWFRISQLLPTSAAVLVSLQLCVEQDVRPETGGYEWACGERLRSFGTSRPPHDSDARRGAVAGCGCIVEKSGAERYRSGAPRSRPEYIRRSPTDRRAAFAAPASPEFPA